MLSEIPEGIQTSAIMADPGIAFRTLSAEGEDRTPQRHYCCSPFDELCGLAVAEIAAADCFLFLWIPLRSIKSREAADAGRAPAKAWLDLYE